MRFRDPWGSRTVAVLLAQLLAMTFNIHRDTNKSRPMTVDDFLPTRITAEPEPEAASTISDVREFLDAIGH